MRCKSLLQKVFQFKGVFLFAFVVAAGILLTIHPVFAAEPEPGTGDQLLSLVLGPLTTILDYVAAGIVKLTLVVMEMLIVPILNYNSFSSSPIIGLGWSLVRDVMNMFVIVALLFIAIFTIVGNHRAHWEQQLPQLFLAVIFMNFSRTICGILIDISQVVMFTFVNALLDIAAGNFAQLFGLQEFGKYNNADIAAVNAAGTGLTTASQFVAAFLRIPLYGAILAVMVMLALAFLYRIVILWVLVILSPASFLMGGLKGVFGSAAGGNEKWWSQFTGALMMGPILTFFLWLSLAAASSGSIAQSENFPVPVSSQSYGLSLEVFDSSHLTSLILALILLIVGMEIAGEQSSKLGGLAGQVINRGMGERIVRTALRTPFDIGAAAGRKADVYAGESGVGLVKSGTFREALGKQVIGAGQFVGAAGAGTPLQGLALSAGRNIASLGGAVELQGEHLRAERKKAASERVGKMSDTEKAANLALISQGQASKVISTQEDFNAMALDFTNDKVQDETKEHIAHNLGRHGIKQGEFELDDDFKVRKDAYDAETKELVKEPFNKIMKETLKYGNDQKKKGNLDDSQAAKINKLNTKFADLLEDPAKWVQDEKFNMGDARNRPEMLEGEGGEAVRKALQAKVGTRKDKEGNFMTVWQEVEKGLHGDKLQKMAAKYPVQKPAPAPRPSISLPEAAASYRAVLTGDNMKENMVRALKAPGGQAFVGTTITEGVGARATTTTIPAAMRPEELARDSEGAVALGGAIVESKIDISKSPIKSDIIQNIVTTQPAGNISEAIKNKQVQSADIPAVAFEPSNTNRTEVVKAVVGAGNRIDVSQMSNDAKDAYAEALGQARQTGAITFKEYTQGQSSLLATGRQIQAVVPGATRTPTGELKLDSGARRDVQAVFKAQPENYKHAVNEVPADALTGSDITRAVAETAQVEDLNKLASKWNDANDTEKKELESAMRAIHKSVEREIAENTKGVNRNYGDDMVEKLKAMRGAGERIERGYGIDLTS